jgi:uncharacterized protein (TIGR00251 family)
MSPRISVYVTPRASGEGIAGFRGDELHLKVAAPPEGGKANAAACKLLAKALGVPKSGVRVVRGDASRHKQLAIEGIDEAELRSFVESHRTE